ncbi:MAG: signal peptidase I [Planctomycetes bacterium]|nr:signal peptidase I [Planctomycetota bacterium]
MLPSLPSGVQLALRGLRLGVLLVAFYSLTFQTPVVRGSSMQPGLQDGDRILIEPWSDIFGYGRGDVVVMRYPLNLDVDYVKRIIGLPGDHLVMGGGRLWINGELCNEPYVTHFDGDSMLSTTVDEGCYFVLGDNRPRSSDSREFGQVRQELVRGRVELRMWPISRLGFLD